LASAAAPSWALAIVSEATVLFIVNQTEQALVLQFGKPIRVIIAPGLRIKQPFIQNAQGAHRQDADDDQRGGGGTRCRGRRRSSRSAATASTVAEPLRAIAPRV
jgi:membrane protease subunit HflC